MDRAEFVAVFGTIYEHSPWVAELAWERRPFASVAALGETMRQIVDAAPVADRLALLHAHPRLGERGALSANSRAEQRGAGLHAAAAEQEERLRELNRAYEASFDFPFIIAVRGLDTGAIIAAASARLANEPEAEFREALQQVHRIAGFRLQALCGE
jgi:2-oxo-4-hydroxy-4-carboxy-5-ureidoimidazoline decarboxylase